MDEFGSLLEGALMDSESLTLLLVAGSDRSEVLRLLGADAESDGRSYPVVDDDQYSGYAAIDVEGGVVAIEHTGYADPSPRVLAELSRLGGTAAVARSNIQAHERFGCARDGSVLFDSDEFMYVDEDEKGAVPSELRPLFDTAWIDLTAADSDDNGPAGIYVAYDGGRSHRRPDHQWRLTTSRFARLPPGAVFHLPRVIAPEPHGVMLQPARARLSGACLRGQVALTSDRAAQRRVAGCCSE